MAECCLETDLKYINNSFSFIKIQDFLNFKVYNPFLNQDSNNISLIALKGSQCKNFLFGGG